MNEATQEKLLVTAALPYANGDIHAGHVAGAYLPADTYVRFMRLRGRKVRFICGSDDFGVAIMLRATADGTTPDEVARRYHAAQAADFEGLGISFDVYGATSQNPYHIRCSQDFFNAIYEKGYFEKQISRQFYDEGAGMFLPDRFVKGRCGYCAAADQHGDQCENCGKILDVESLQEPRSVVTGNPATVRETAHWFLDLSRFEETVGKWLEKAEIRDTSKRYVRGLLSAGLVKRSMTRDINWGVPVPLNDPEARGKVLYVWFDAPIGYISNTMQLAAERGEPPEKADDWWRSPDSEVIHFIGEDNTIFHCVIWIAMLSAEGSLNLPRAVVINQFLNVQFPGREVEKISKSRGTALWIKDYLASGHSPDSLRYYLTMIAPEKARATFKPDDLMQRHNSELADTIGNFVHRILSFTHKYVGPQIPEIDQTKVAEVDSNFLAAMQSCEREAAALLEQFEFKGALERIMQFARSCNRYVDEKAPWTTRKTDMETTKVTLAYALKAVHFLGVVLTPFIPFAMRRLAEMLKLNADDLRWSDALKPAVAGSALGEPQILFSKLEEQPWKDSGAQVTKQ